MELVVSVHSSHSEKMVPKQCPWGAIVVVVTLSFNTKMVLANFECNLND